MKTAPFAFSSRVGTQPVTGLWGNGRVASDISMKTFLTFTVTHALVFAGAFAFTATPLGVASIFSGLFAASLLGLGWLDLSRRIEPLSVRAEIVRPGAFDRSSGRPTVRSRRAA